MKSNGHNSIKILQENFDILFIEVIKLKENIFV